MALMRGLLLFVIMQALVACSYMRDWRDLPQSHQDKKHIYVVSHGWHTGVVVAKENISPALTFLNPYFGDGKFYEIGWGDKGFYQAEEITSGLSLKAILWPTESVMHIVSLSASPDKVFPNSETIKVTISGAGHEKHNQAILASFAKTENGEVVKTGKGLYGDSLFFEGDGYFFMTNTCNTWVSEMLFAAGLPMSTFLTLTASSVMRQVSNAIEREYYQP